MPSRIPQISLCRGAGTLHFRSELLLRDAIKQYSPNGLSFGWKYYPNELHGSVEIAAEYDALHFLFDNYLFIGYKAIYNPNGRGAKIYADHYATISKNFGYIVQPPENLITYFAYDFLKKKNNRGAYGFFNLWIQTYPDDYNAYDSMGDYYEATADQTKAIEYFRKALAMKDNPDTRKKLDHLTGK